MIGALIIGDEITRGRRQDKHFAKLIEILKARGMHLDWAQYLGDDPASYSPPKCLNLPRPLTGLDMKVGRAGAGWLTCLAQLLEGGSGRRHAPPLAAMAAAAAAAAASSWSRSKQHTQLRICVAAAASA